MWEKHGTGWAKRRACQWLVDDRRSSPGLGPGMHDRPASPADVGGVGARGLYPPVAAAAETLLEWRGVRKVASTLGRGVTARQ